jgi:hypothetical protein
MSIWKRLFGKPEKIVDMIDPQAMNQLRRSLIPILNGAGLTVRQHQLILSVCGLRPGSDGSFMDAVPLNETQTEDPGKKFMQAIIRIEHAVVSGKVDILAVKEVVTQALELCANAD